MNVTLYSTSRISVFSPPLTSRSRWIRWVGQVVVEKLLLNLKKAVSVMNCAAFNKTISTTTRYTSTGAFTQLRRYVKLKALMINPVDRCRMYASNKVLTTERACICNVLQLGSLFFGYIFIIWEHFHNIEICSVHQNLCGLFIANTRRINHISGPNCWTPVYDATY